MALSQFQMNYKSMNFETKRTRCSLLTMDDEKDFCHLYTDKKVMRKIGPPVSYAQARRFFERALDKNKSHELSQKIWKIEEKGNNTFLGILMLKWKPNIKDVAEIGIMLAPKSNQKGIANEAMGALTDYGFIKLHLKMVMAFFDKTHYATERLVKKLGYTVIPPDKSPAVGEGKSYCFVTPEMRNFENSAEAVCNKAKYQNK
ncbi:GNAT family N-acetyltransferase [Alteromonas sp. H39]|uniref:GNAT family N-acetyltransferase n=1 Tax=Alteromonas sp. H39 TaxID=3389876 RepID=UPI0039E1D68B